MGGRGSGRTWASIQVISASRSERQSRLRGPWRQELNRIGMSSASGRYAISRSTLPDLRQSNDHT